MVNGICSGIQFISHPVVCHRVYNFIFRILLLYNPPSPGGWGIFISNPPGNPGAGDFKTQNTPGYRGGENSKGVFFYETRQKNLKSTLAGKLNLNWPYSPALPQRPKFKFYFPAKESKDFLAGFIEK